MNRKEILEAASKAVHAKDLNHDYGKPEDNFETIADLWSTYLEAAYGEDTIVCLSSRDVAAMMILLKVARVATSEKADHWVDIAGYAACGGEIDGPCTNKEDAETITLRSLGDINGNGPLELHFTVKKEDE